MIRPSRGGGGAGILIAVLFSFMGVMMGLVAVAGRLGPLAIPIWAIAIGGMVAIGRGPIGTALAARIHPDGGARSEGEALPHEVYAELDELRGRVAELEERQDFAERLLSTQSQAAAGPDR